MYPQLRGPNLEGMTGMNNGEIELVARPRTGGRHEQVNRFTGGWSAIHVDGPVVNEDTKPGKEDRR